MPEIVYDPIHNIISFNEREKQVINHPFFQRLRFIRQLGLKSFVYPGAVNDRFSHGLGAMHLAGRVFDQLESNDVISRLPIATQKYLRQVLRFAALLHDVGHGPFSHASETLMPPLKTLDVPRGWYTKYNEKATASHEDYSVLLIRTLGSEKEKIFSADEAQDTASLVHKTINPSATWKKKFKTAKEASSYHNFLKHLISGELDVDRMDYLLRDAYFTGVTYGKYDLEWLLHTIGAHMTVLGPKLTLHESGLRAFEDFLLARYHMFLQVYFHRTTSIFEYYVEQAVKIKEITLSIPSDPYSYSELRDGSIIEAMFNAAKNKRNIWSGMLARREPMKLLFRHDTNDKKSVARYNRILASLKKNKIFFVLRQAHRALSEQVELKSGASGILVENRFLDRSEYQTIEEVSSLLRKYNEQIGRIYIYIWRKDWPKTLKILHREFKMK